MIAYSEPEPKPDPLPPKRAARQQSILHDAGTDALIRDIQSLRDDDTPAPVIARIGFPSTTDAPTLA